MKKILICALLAQGVYASSDFDEFRSGFDQYAQQMSEGFEEYKRVYLKEFEEFKKELAKYWPTQDITTNDTWVEYSKDLRDRKVVDYEHGQINLEVIAEDEDEARKRILDLIDQLAHDTTVSAYNNDQIEQNVQKQVDQPKKEIVEIPMVSDVMDPQELQRQREKVEKEDLKVTEYEGNTIYTVDIKMPPDHVLKKAQSFWPMVKQYGEQKRVDADLIYAIMHSESSFNPMARSHIPAFGLMQIVPSSAGRDVNNLLHNHTRAPSSDFLYDPNNSILFGASYLHILNYRYLSAIEDPLSRLYCVIAAYNTGAGNVARAFIGSNNVSRAAQKINAMSPQQVFDHLVQNLPYEETRNYLVKVQERLPIYERFVSQQ